MEKMEIGFLRSGPGKRVARPLLISIKCYRYGTKYWQRQKNQQVTLLVSGIQSLLFHRKLQIYHHFDHLWQSKSYWIQRERPRYCSLPGQQFQLLLQSPHHLQKVMKG